MPKVKYYIMKKFVGSQCQNLKSKIRQIRSFKLLNIIIEKGIKWQDRELEIEKGIFHNNLFS